METEPTTTEATPRVYPVTPEDLAVLKEYVLLDAASCARTAALFLDTSCAKETQGRIEEARKGMEAFEALNAGDVHELTAHDMKNLKFAYAHALHKRAKGLSYYMKSKPLMKHGIGKVRALLDRLEELNEMLPD